jgi:transposase
MRFVPIKSEEQLDLQSVHRVRERWVMRRTAVVNQIRGLLLERGITLRKGRSYVDAALPGILADVRSKLSGSLLVLLTELKLELAQLAEKIDRSDAAIAQIARQNEACQRLVAMPGVGPVTATAIIATIGNGAAFRKDATLLRGWVVPEEHSTGGKQTPWELPRGNKYLRMLFVQGARAVMQHKTKQSSWLTAWLAQLTARTHHNIAIVALANKLARMAWAVLAKNEVYRPPILVDAIAG